VVSGYHRLVATLFHQKNKISKFDHVIESNNLIGREFSSKEFVKTNQSNLTPAAFSFAQGKQ